MFLVDFIISLKVDWKTVTIYANFVNDLEKVEEFNRFFFEMNKNVETHL